MNSGISPGQSEAEPEKESPIKLPFKPIQTIRSITNRDNQDREERLPVHQTLTSRGTTVTKESKASPLADHQPSVKGGLWKTDKLI